ncbi:hypothetical protein X975_21188, partial [Stegodyphus mimosarum]
MIIFQHFSLISRRRLQFRNLISSAKTIKYTLLIFRVTLLIS